MNLPLTEVNFKRRDNAEVRRLERSLKEFGQTDAHVVVIDANNNVVMNHGHEVCQALKNNGATHVRVYQKRNAHPCG